jgi:hypothetical protein
MRPGEAEKKTGAKGAFSSSADSCMIVKKSSPISLTLIFF